MKFYTNCHTLEELKAEYKRLAKMYHPDCGGSDEMMAQVNAQYDELAKRLPKTRADGTTYQPKEEEREAPEQFRAAVAAIIGLKGLQIELCGAWLWVTGETYQHRDALKAAGYRWSKNKNAWYWHEEGYQSKSRKRYSMEEIRDMQGSERITGSAYRPALQGA